MIFENNSLTVLETTEKTRLLKIQKITTNAWEEHEDINPNYFMYFHLRIYEIQAIPSLQGREDQEKA